MERAAKQQQPSYKQVMLLMTGGGGVIRAPQNTCRYVVHIQELQPQNRKEIPFESLKGLFSFQFIIDTMWEAKSSLLCATLSSHLVEQQAAKRRYSKEWRWSNGDHSDRYPSRPCRLLGTRGLFGVWWLQTISCAAMSVNCWQVQKDVRKKTFVETKICFTNWPSRCLCLLLEYILN